MPDGLMMWSPGKLQSNCNLRSFMAFVNKRLGYEFDSYESLHKWSVEELSLFWESFLEFSKIKMSVKHSKIIDEKADMNTIPTWFEGCKMNYAENILNCDADNDKVALYGKKEGDVGYVTRTWSQLRENVRLLSSAMLDLGVSPGERVVGYLPNCIEAIEAMLAAAAIGAVWSSTSPDFGPKGVLDRFRQIDPVIMFTVNGVVYNGRVHDHIEKVSEVVKGLPSLRRLVVLPFIKEKSCGVSNFDKGCTWNEFTSGFEGTPMKFIQLPFHHPLFVMFSSGTTGAPKCIVHSAGGTLITHMKEHLLHCDFGPKDVLVYYSTTGWMMWNWAASALACGTSILCYDGSPLRPHDSFMWDLVDEIGVTVLGTSAKWLAVMEERGVHPILTHKLRGLRMILSTGSPLQPSSYEYVYSKVKKDVHLGSITGGTDIIGCFAGANPMQSVYRGEIQSALLGMAVEIWDDKGNAVQDESGELVCTKPFPSMPVYFWNDKGGEKYHSAYFAKFPGIWCHGDFCLMNSHTKGIVMLGRSDGTLNPNGVRFGSAEIYNIVEKFEEVDDSLCVGRCDEICGEIVILFLKLAPIENVLQNGSSKNSEEGLSRYKCPAALESKIRSSIRTVLSARHVPNKIFVIQDIPYTLSGKKVEIAVRHILNGRGDRANSSSLTNPQSLQHYIDILPFI